MHAGPLSTIKEINIPSCDATSIVKKTNINPCPISGYQRSMYKGKIEKVWVKIKYNIRRFFCKSLYYC